MATERERIREEEPRNTPGVYATAGTARTMETVSTEIPDLVRWGPIVAGLFITLALLVVLSVLGLAIGLSSYNVGDPLSNFGVGAGVWGIISALVAFGVGGWVAGGTIGLRGRNNGAINGAILWAVAIPLLLFMLASGVGTLLTTAGQVVASGAEIVGPAAGQVLGDPNLQATAQALPPQVTPQQQEEAVANASRAAWGTMLWFLLSVLAAAGGGYFAARRSTETAHMPAQRA